MARIIVSGGFHRVKPYTITVPDWAAENFLHEPYHRGSFCHFWSHFITERQYNLLDKHMCPVPGCTCWGVNGYRVHFEVVVHGERHIIEDPFEDLDIPL